MKLSRFVFFNLLFVLLSINGFATPPKQKMSWQEWLNHVERQAIQRGVTPQVAKQALDNLEPGKTQLRLNRSQPEKRLTYLEYRDTRISDYRIKIGRRKFNQEKNLLMQIGHYYGVDPCVIASIWGLETSYGNYMGNFPVIRSLATLAYASDRYEFFHKELLYALEILDGGHITLAKFKGEWAGASGQTQFLPSSWLKYAVDHNGNGHKNIWTELPDALASTANYLKKNGWQSEQPWGTEVRLSSNFNRNQVGLDIQKRLSYWLHHGVQPKPGARLPSGDPLASVIYPYGGPALLVFKNFRVIMTYNSSTYYAASVAYLADQICRRN